MIEFLRVSTFENKIHGSWYFTYVGRCETLLPIGKITYPSAHMSKFVQFTRKLVQWFPRNCPDLPFFRYFANISAKFLSSTNEIFFSTFFFVPTIERQYATHYEKSETI